MALAPFNASLPNMSYPLFEGGLAHEGYQKTLAYVIGEQLLLPLIQRINDLYHSCTTNMLWGAAASVSLQNPLPLAAAATTCLPEVEARRIVHQGAVILGKGESFYSESNRKAVVHKGGRTCWNGKEDNLAGPPMKVTVLESCGNDKKVLLHNDAYNSSNSWFAKDCYGGTSRLSIEVHNPHEQASAIYVHTEDH